MDLSRDQTGAADQKKEQVSVHIGYYQIGNLALVCTRRPEVLLQAYHSKVTVHVGQGPERMVLCAAWADDTQICRIIHELNFGTYSGGKVARWKN